MYPNLYFDDWLWANIIRGAEWLRQIDWIHINSPVLLSLFRMGILDWTRPNDRMHQATQAIQHSTAMHLYTLPRITKLESRVMLGFVCPDCTLVLTVCTGGEGAWKPMKTSWVHCRLWLKVPTTYLPITDWVHSKCTQINLEPMRTFMQHLECNINMYTTIDPP